MKTSRFATALSILTVAPTAVLAYSGPESYLIELDCTIVQKCDQQLFCKKTDEPTQVILTSLVHDLSFSRLLPPKDFPFESWQEVTAWVELTNSTTSKVPLPVWYLEDAGFDRDVTFQLEDWLSGQKESPYDFKGYALVMTGDLEDISDSRANLDAADDLPWQITIYKKLRGETGKYRTQDLLCDAGL